jgi:pimeloyl-ACP methyl ester carboxylesterase
MKLNYEIRGDGAPIILVHGWGGSIESLRALAALLSKKHKTIILDLPGFGASPKPPLDWGIGEYADSIIELLRSLKVKRINYFGHSFGGSLGIYIAAKNPELISRLILCAPSYKRELKTLKGVSLFKKIIPAGLKPFLYHIFLPGSDLGKFPHLEANFRKIVTQDLSPLSQKIKNPTLVLWGDQDSYTPVAGAQVLNAKIKSSKLKIFKGIGHGLPLKYPDLVYKEVDRFI